MVEYSSWYKCHKQSWGKDLVPEAYSHPAKVSRGLARKIYSHAIERGWLKEGDVCLDPFAGIGGFALDAMFHGLHFVGVELEEKFVSLAQQNIDLWNKRYSRLPRWGTAVILQGDSRNLIEVLEGARAEGIVASPPYSKGLGHEGKESKIELEKGYPSPQFGGYGTDARNLGNMPTGELPQANGIVASPPYMEQVIRRRDPGKPGFNQGLTQGKHAFDEYGTTDGQLAAMYEGDVDAVIASPPWAQAQSGGGIAIKGTPAQREECPGGSIATTGYQFQGHGPGQLAALPEGEPPAGIVSSPPWEQSLDRGTVPKEARVKQARNMDLSAAEVSPIDMENIGLRTQSDYGSSNGQLGQESGNTFWSAAKTILLQCHQVLAPGGESVPDAEGIEFCDC